MTDIIKLAREAEQSAVKTLEQLGYTYHGGELWKPPLGKAPDFNLIDLYRADAERWRYSVAIVGNQTMNWLDVYDDWDGDGDFTDQIDAARAKEQT